MTSAGTARVPSAQRRGAAAVLATTAGAGVAALVAVGVRDPHVAGSWGTCPLLATTGLYCPGCGGLRAVHDLLHADLVAAASSNVVVVAVLVLAAAAWAVTAVSMVRRRTVRWERWVTGRTTTVALVALVAFSVLRNTPLAAGLAP